MGRTWQQSAFDVALLWVPDCSKWGPCEHMSCALEHEGCITAVNLPELKAKVGQDFGTRPPQGAGAVLVPGCGLASNSGAASSTSAPPKVHHMSEADVALQTCLRAAGLGSTSAICTRMRHTKRPPRLHFPRLQSLLWHDDRGSSQSHAAVN